MRTMTKRECDQFYRMAREEITNALGAGTVDPLSWTEWQFPYGDGGTVTIHLIKHRPLEYMRGYARPWLACRYHNPELLSHGYLKPGVRHPWPFDRLSGKCNFLPMPGHNHRAELAAHLYRLAGPDTPDWSRYSALEIGGCIDCDGAGTIEGGHDRNEAAFFTVYGRLTEGGCDAITDAATFDQIAEIAARLGAISGLQINTYC